jgi:DNA primase
MQMVLDHYQVNWLRKSGQELRGKCPIHQGEGERTFHANLSKNAFNCFSCKARGNVLDFVAAMEKCAVREAALLLAEWFNVDSDGEVGEMAHSSQARSAVPDGSKTRAKPKEPENMEINPPLKFNLRVDPNHEYGLGRGLTAETLDCFGAGFCLSKGTFAGRFVIPLHDEQGRLVGYAGRSLDNSEPKYLFPHSDKGFRKSHLVFNLHRVLKTAGAGDRVVVVEGFFGCMLLAQAGYHALGLLGSSLSEVQEELLAQNFHQMILLFDGDDAGRKATEDCLKRLAKHGFVHVIELPDGRQPDQFSPDELHLIVGLD